MLHAGHTTSLRLPHCRSCCHHRHLQRCRAASTSEAVTIFRVTSPADFDRVGEIRAAAFYEENQGAQYARSFQRQFAQQESGNWQRNFRRDPEGQEKQCLGAYVQDVLQGCLDIVRQAPEQRGGVSSAYVKNVAVHKSHRRKQLAAKLLAAARETAAREWQASVAYTHVEQDNEAARQLYLSCGYKPADGDGYQLPAAVSPDRVASQGPTEFLCLEL